MGCQGTSVAHHTLTERQRDSRHKFVERAGTWPAVHALNSRRIRCVAVLNSQHAQVMRSESHAMLAGYAAGHEHKSKLMR